MKFQIKDEKLFVLLESFSNFLHEVFDFMLN